METVVCLNYRVSQNQNSSHPIQELDSLPLDTEVTSEGDRRERIMDVALEIAAGEGVKGASLRRIAGAIGMRTATLYSYFPGGKDEIISAAMVSLTTRFKNEMDAAVREEDSSLENLRRIVFTHVRWATVLTPKTSPAWESIRIADAMSPVLTEDCRRVITQIEDNHHALVRDLIADLGTPITDARRWAKLITIICESSKKWCDDGDQEQPDSAQFENFEMAWFSIRRLLGRQGSDGVNNNTRI